MNSQRRGVPSHDADAVARRAWYEETLKAAATRRDDKEDESKERIIAAKTGGDQGGSTSGPAFVGGFAMAMLSELEAIKAKPAADAKAVEDKAQPKEELEYVHARDFDASRWIINLTPPPTSENATDARLVCFHGIGCNYLYFQSWAKQFQKEGVHLFAICLPGRLFRLREKCKSIRDAAWAIVDAISQSWPTTNELYFFGHDLGAIVAFEVAKLLGCVKHLVVSSVRSPTLLASNNADRFVTKHFCSSDADLMALIKVLGAVPDIFLDKNRRELFNQLLPSIRSDFTLLEKYTKPTRDTTISCPITAVGAVGDRSCSAEELSTWRAETSASSHFLQHEFFAGGHSYLALPDKEDILLAYLVELCHGGTPAFPKEESEW